MEQSQFLVQFLKNYIKQKVGKVKKVKENKWMKDKVFQQSQDIAYNTYFTSENSNETGTSLYRQQENNNKVDYLDEYNLNERQYSELVMLLDKQYKNKEIISKNLDLNKINYFTYLRSENNSPSKNLDLYFLQNDNKYSYVKPDISTNDSKSQNANKLINRSTNSINKEKKTFLNHRKANSNDKFIKVDISEGDYIFGNKNIRESRQTVQYKSKNQEKQQDTSHRILNREDIQNNQNQPFKNITSQTPQNKLNNNIRKHKSINSYFYSSFSNTSQSFNKDQFQPQKNNKFLNDTKNGQIEQASQVNNYFIKNGRASDDENDRFQQTLSLRNNDSTKQPNSTKSVNSINFDYVINSSITNTQKKQNTKQAILPFVHLKQNAKKGQINTTRSSPKNNNILFESMTSNRDKIKQNEKQKMNQDQNNKFKLDLSKVRINTSIQPKYLTERSNSLNKKETPYIENIQKFEAYSENENSHPQQQKAKSLQLQLQNFNFENSKDNDKFYKSQTEQNKSKRNSIINYTNDQQNDISKGMNKLISNTESSQKHIKNKSVGSPETKMHLKIIKKQMKQKEQKISNQTQNQNLIIQDKLYEQIYNQEENLNQINKQALLLQLPIDYNYSLLIPQNISEIQINTQFDQGYDQNFSSMNEYQNKQNELKTLIQDDKANKVIQPIQNKVNQEVRDTQQNQKTKQNAQKDNQQNINLISKRRSQQFSSLQFSAINLFLQKQNSQNFTDNQIISSRNVESSKSSDILSQKDAKNIFTLKNIISSRNIDSQRNVLSLKISESEKIESQSNMEQSQELNSTENFDGEKLKNSSKKRQSVNMLDMNLLQELGAVTKKKKLSLNVVNDLGLFEQNDESQDSFDVREDMYGTKRSINQVSSRQKAASMNSPVFINSQLNAMYKESQQKIQDGSQSIYLKDIYGCDIDPDFDQYDSNGIQYYCDFSSAKEKNFYQVKIKTPIDLSTFDKDYKDLSRDTISIDNQKKYEEVKRPKLSMHYDQSSDKLENNETMIWKYLHFYRNKETLERKFQQYLKQCFMGLKQNAQQIKKGQSFSKKQKQKSTLVKQQTSQSNEDKQNKFQNSLIDIKSTKVEQNQNTNTQKVVNSILTNQVEKDTKALPNSNGFIKFIVNIDPPQQIKESNNKSKEESQLNAQQKKRQTFQFISYKQQQMQSQISNSSMVSNTSSDNFQESNSSSSQSSIENYIGHDSEQEDSTFPHKQNETERQIDSHNFISNIMNDNSNIKELQKSISELFRNNEGSKPQLKNSTDAFKKSFIVVRNYLVQYFQSQVTERYLRRIDRSKKLVSVIEMKQVNQFQSIPYVTIQSLDGIGVAKQQNL